jgi:hypothetical protein
MFDFRLAIYENLKKKRKSLTVYKYTYNKRNIFVKRILSKFLI